MRSRESRKQSAWKSKFKSTVIKEKLTGNSPGDESERELFYDDIFNHFTHCAPEATEFGEITQNKAHYVVQGNSRSPILVPIESSYTTLY